VRAVFLLVWYSGRIDGKMCEIEECVGCVRPQVTTEACMYVQSTVLSCYAKCFTASIRSGVQLRKDLIVIVLLFMVYVLFYKAVTM
jgi:hypothetical protein